MLKTNNIILTSIIACLLLLHLGCNQSPPNSSEPNINANIKQEPKVEVVVNKPDEVGLEPPLFNPPLDDGLPGVLLPIDGGGSQGASQGARTGNPDQNVREPRPDGECGNGEQEVLPNPPGACPHLIYGVAGSSGNNLYYFDKDDGEGHLIGTINDAYFLSALDFSPNGTLYAIALQDEIDDSGKMGLFTINCTNAQATKIADLTGIEGNDTIGEIVAITDINFDRQGRLWAMRKSPSGGGTKVYTINIVNGAATLIGPTNTGNGPSGNGLAFAPFPQPQTLFHVYNSTLSSINQSTGQASFFKNLSFPAELSDKPRINAMDLDPFPNNNQIMYVSINDDTAGSYLGELNLSNGSVSKKSVAAPARLDALAINRRYEECDPPATEEPNNNYECIDCKLHEKNCGDAKDNDFDGLTDCDDNDCQNQSCNDGLACTINDTCQENSCNGQAPNCNDLNPCTADSCEEPSEGDQYLCQHTDLNNNPCEIDGRACTMGLCLSGTCKENNRSLMPLESGGCQDDNVCTSDSCIESWSRGNFNGDIILAQVPWGSTANKDEQGNVILDNDFQCTEESNAGSPCYAEDACLPGICKISESNGEKAIACEGDSNIDDPYAHCPDEDNNVCTTETCGIELGCVSRAVATNSTCNDSDPCTITDKCQNVLQDFNCFGTPKVKVLVAAGGCDDSLACTMDMCSLGGCSNTPDNQYCDDNNPCTTDTCDATSTSGDGCKHVAVTAITACDDNSFCTINDTCNAGICSGTARTCDDQNTCTTDSCDTATDSCVYKVPEEQIGQTCNAYDLCTKDAKCNNMGQCLGVYLNCDDENQCTDDSCTYEGTCTHTNKTEGSSCQDDNNQCTDDICTGDGTCAHASKADGISCQDGNTCTFNDTCQNGACEPGEGPVCPPMVCNTVTCDTDDECRYIPLPDSTPAGGECTVPDKLGKCAEGAYVCVGGVATNMCVSLYMPQTEICGNDVDDDCDGLSDAEDPDCPKLVFVTDGEFIGGDALNTGNDIPINTVDGANQKCQAEAIIAGKTGSFEAWISDSLGNSPSMNFTPSSIPYALANGVKVANNYADLTDGTIINPININAFGVAPGGVSTSVWTATSPTGISTGAGSNCNNWTTQNAASPAAIAGNMNSNTTWTTALTLPCDVKARLYCFEQ